MKFVTIPFYFRTTDEYWMARKIISTKFNGSGYNHGLRLTTKYRMINKKTNPISIPKKIRGKKKYLATIYADPLINKNIIKIIETQLVDAGIELVERLPGKKKYSDKVTKKRYVIKSHSELRAMTSIFARAFGSGNFRFRGPNDLHAILKNLEAAQNRRPRPAWMGYTEAYQNGVPVTIIVNKENADIDRCLFMVKLKNG